MTDNYTKFKQILIQDDNYKKSLPAIFQLQNIVLQSLPHQKYQGWNLETYGVQDVKNRILEIAIENIAKFKKLTILEVEKLKETFYKLFEALNEASTKEEDFYYDFIIKFYNKLNS